MKERLKAIHNRRKIKAKLRTPKLHQSPLSRKLVAEHGLEKAEIIELEQKKALEEKQKEIDKLKAQLNQDIRILNSLRNADASGILDESQPQT